MLLQTTWGSILTGWTSPGQPANSLWLLIIHQWPCYASSNYNFYESMCFFLFFQLSSLLSWTLAHASLTMICLFYIHIVISCGRFIHHEKRRGEEDIERETIEKIYRDREREDGEGGSKGKEERKRDGVLARWWQKEEERSNEGRMLPQIRVQWQKSGCSKSFIFCSVLEVMLQMTWRILLQLVPPYKDKY